MLRGGEVDDSRLKSRRLGAYSFGIVGSPDYFARAGVPANPEDLLEHACLHRKHPTTGKIQPWPFAQSAWLSNMLEVVLEIARPNSAVDKTGKAFLRDMLDGITTALAE